MYQALSSEKQHAEKEVAELSKIFKGPTDVEDFQPVLRYSLRGVGLHRGPVLQIIYVLRIDPEEPSLIDMEDELQEQLWKMSYETSGAVFLHTEVRQYLISENWSQY